ncbi:MAG: hypothetical protein AAB438_00615 [Patescibacteria group bacterium]
MALTFAQKKLLEQLEGFDEWKTEDKKFYRNLLFVAFTCEMPGLRYSIVYKFSTGTSKRIYNVQVLKAGILNKSQHIKKISRITPLQNGKIRIKYLNDIDQVVTQDYSID